MATYFNVLISDDGRLLYWVTSLWFWWQCVGSLKLCYWQQHTLLAARETLRHHN